jgi:hypothetical protein
MNSTPDGAQPDFLVTLACVLGRSRAGQLVVAMLIASVSIGLAYLAWQHREIAGLILTFLVLSHGLQKAWESLPISVGMRQAWARWRKLYNFVFTGCFLMAQSYVSSHSWPGWPFLAVWFLVFALFSITDILAWVDDLDRSRKKANS